MLRRWHVLLMIAFVLLATCLVAASKLRATPNYDRVKVGMKSEQVVTILGKSSGDVATEDIVVVSWESDEGTIIVAYKLSDEPTLVIDTAIRRRGPLERLAWLAGWR